MSSRIFAVCSTTSATGSDEKDVTVGCGGASSTIESSASTTAVVWDADDASGGGKFVIGEIGASLMMKLRQSDLTDES